MMLIGWFLAGSSRAEGAAAVQQGILDLRRADQLMSAPPVTVPGDITVEHLVEAYVLGRHHSAFPVVDETGRLVGLVGLDQVRRVPLDRRPHTSVKAIAEPLDTVPVVAPEDTGSAVLARLNLRRATRALVVDPHRGLVGIISNTDLARTIAVGAPPTKPTSPSSG
jgi:CBS domain-containing protein